MDDNLHLDKIPAIGISFQCALHGQRQIVLQTFVERDCDVATLNAILDKLRDASERQYAWGQVEQLKLELKREHATAEQQQLNIERADQRLRETWNSSNRKGELRLTQAEIQQQRQAYDNAEAIKKRIASMKEDLARWEARVANGGVGSLSDGAG
jgi:hypothetical protein